MAADSSAATSPSSKVGDLVRLRPVADDETGAIVSLWTNSYKHRPGGMAPWFWTRAHQAGVREVLPNSTVLVAELPEVPGEIIGWVAFEPPTTDKPLWLHYVFVKPAYRRAGIGSRLVLAALDTADGRGFRRSHETKVGEQLMEGIGYGMG